MTLLGIEIGGRKDDATTDGKLEIPHESYHGKIFSVLPPRVTQFPDWIDLKLIINFPPDSRAVPQECDCAIPLNRCNER